MPARLKAWVWSQSLAGIVVSNSTGEMEVYLLRFLCVIRKKSLRRANQSSRGVMPSMVCPVSMIAKPCKGKPLSGIGSKSGIKKCVPFWNFLAQRVTLWRTRVQIYFHLVHIAHQTRTFFLSNHNLFSDSNYEAPHYVISPNPVTSSAIDPHLLSSTLNLYFLDMHCLSGGFLPEMLVFHSAGHLIHHRRFIPYADTTTWITLSVHISRSLIVISAIVTKRLDGSEKFPFAQTTNHLYTALQTGSVLRVV